MIAVPIYAKFGGSYYYEDWVSFEGIIDYDQETGTITDQINHNNGIWSVNSDPVKDTFKINLILFQ